MNVFEQAATAHERWRQAFEHAVRNGGGDLLVEVVRVDSLCPLGMWLDSHGRQAVSNLTASGILSEIHAEFHLAAAKVLSLALACRVQDAVAAMDQDAQYGQWSGLLGSALRRYVDMASELESRSLVLSYDVSA